MVAELRPNLVIHPASDHGASSDCPNCGAELVGRYCHDCGQKRIDHHDLTAKHFFGHFFHEIVHLDSKIFRTLYALLFRPGLLTVEHLEGRQGRFINPIRLFLTVTAVFFLFFWGPMMNVTKARDVMVAQLRQPPLAQRIEKKGMDVAKAAEIVEARYAKVLTFGKFLHFPGLALWLVILFRRSGKFFVEHLVFALHYTAFSYSLAIPLVLVGFGLNALAGQFISVPLLIPVLSILLSLGYLFFALKNVYGESSRRTFLKTSALFVLDMVGTLIGYTAAQLYAMAWLFF